VSVVLGAGTSSRLYQKVREENGLVYSIMAMAYPFTDTGIFGINFSTSSENAGKVFQLIASELKRMKEDGLEDGELVRAKRWLKGLIVRKLEPMENRMFFLGEQYLQTKKLMTEDQILQKMEAVTEEDMARSAVEILDPKRMNLVLHMAKKEGSAMARSLGSLDF
jgi:predicted Zn-dependent peptidase